MSKDTTLHMIATDYTGLKTGVQVAWYWHDLARTFERRNPHISIDVQLIPVDRADREVATMVKAGNVPDLAQLATYSSFAADGELYSADVLFPISVQADFIPSPAQAGSVDRVQYGIPWVASTQ